MRACFGSFEKPRGKILRNHSISLRDRSDSEMEGKPPSTYAPLSTTSMSSCCEWTPSFAYTCETCVFPFDNGAPTNMTLEAAKGINEGLIQNGYIVVADTIEELAEGLGLPAETLKKTVSARMRITTRANLKRLWLGSQRRFFVRLFRERPRHSAPINRVSCLNGRHKQRLYSFGRIAMPLIHKRGFPLLDPKLARHLGHTLRPNRIEHANTLAYRICKRPSSFHDEHCRIADDATKPQITRASAAALQPNQAIPA